MAFFSGGPHPLEYHVTALKKVPSIHFFGKKCTLVSSAKKRAIDLPFKMKAVVLQIVTDYLYIRAHNNFYSLPLQPSPMVLLGRNAGKMLVYSRGRNQKRSNPPPPMRIGCIFPALSARKQVRLGQILEVQSTSSMFQP